MSEQASYPPGWIVVVREWGNPDEQFYAVIPDPREAEEQVRDAAQTPPRASVQAIRELTQDEIDTLGLQPGKIIHAPKK